MKTSQTRPLVIGTLLGPSSLASQLSVARRTPIDYLEIRLDSFPSLKDPRDFVKNIKRRTKKPLLLTIRSQAERGVRFKGAPPLSDRDRLALFSGLLPLVDLVDVELRHLALLKKITSLAHRKGVDVIHSCHKFSPGIPWSKITALSKLSLRNKGDIFKVAVAIRSEKELHQFLKHGMNLRNKKKILIGMGPAGLMSRLLGFSFGSDFTYGHLGRAAAPGQMHARDLIKSIRAIYHA